MNCTNKNGNCINEILSVILVLQENACPENCLDTCDRPMLGACAAGTTSDTCSTVFRVEKIEGNCCTFRVLVTNPDETSLNPYVSTNSFFTMDCSCLCCIRCLTDCYVDCVC